MKSLVVPSPKATTAAPFGATASTAVAGTAVGVEAIESSSVQAPPGALRATTRRVDTLCMSTGIVISMRPAKATPPSANANPKEELEASDGYGTIAGAVQPGTAPAGAGTP